MLSLDQQVRYLDTLESIAIEVIRPAAAVIDETGTFPRQAMNTLGQSGLLG
jgi:hypothetical protein